MRGGFLLFFGFAGGFPFGAAAGGGFLGGCCGVQVGFVEGAFMSDPLRQVLGAGAAAGGHHDAPAGGR